MEEKIMNLHSRKFSSAALFALAAASTPALSQDTGWYGGLGIGQSTFVGACDGISSPDSCEEKDTAWKIFGGYQFNRNFAGEFGYTVLVKTTLPPPRSTLFPYTTRFSAYDLMPSLKSSVLRVQS